jgi:hypothetical protein
MDYLMKIVQLNSYVASKGKYTELRIRKGLFNYTEGFERTITYPSG